MRKKAVAKAAETRTRIEVRGGVAESLPFPSNHMDAAVSSLTLCSLQNPRAALLEIHRVLVLGGVLRFYEHVLSGEPNQRRRQRLADFVWSRSACGCHLTRDSEAEIAHAGFDITKCLRFSFTTSWLDSLAAPHILGTAVRR